MIVAYPHQELFAEKVWLLLKATGYAYLAGKPRSGKTYTSILVAEKSDKISRVLVLTKKAAISGWEKFIVGNTILKHTYTVTNYEQAHKLNPDNYDLVIIDESHNLGTLGRPSKRIKTIQKLCWEKPHIHLSGTAIVESPCGIYHQMAISKYRPFKHKNFYDFHREFGEPYYIKIGGREINQYDKAKDTLMAEINKFTIYMTQEDAGISADVQATDELHYVELGQGTKYLYNTIQTDLIAKVCEQMLGSNDPNWQLKDMLTAQALDIGTLDLVCDTTMKLRTSLHMLESGVVKIEDEYIELGNTEKIDYIRRNFGDSKDVGVMCHFIGERRLLERTFNNINVYSSSAHAEGVDLSHLRHFVILSSDYSGSKFIQRRDRIVNINGSNTTTVHHILVKKAISEQVYKKVSKKEDFNNSTYEAQSL